MSVLLTTAFVALAGMTAGIASWHLARRRLKEDLQRAQAEAKDLSEENARLETSVDNLESDVRSEEQRAEGLEEKRAALQAQKAGLSEMKGRLEEQVQGRDDEIARLKEALTEARNQAETHRRDAEARSAQVTRLEGDREKLAERLQQQEKDLGRIQEAFVEQFENLATRILEEKSEKFTTQNQEQIGQLLKPLRQKIGEFEKEVREGREKSVEARAKLHEKLENLADLNHQLSEDAQGLASALEGQSKTQGDWGEMILERLLEESGLRPGSEYVVQESISSGDGRRLRPDVVVKLPRDRCLVIDAKVSIRAYKRYCEAEEEKAREKALKGHLRALRAHYETLSGKGYEKALSKEGSPDFVLMFVPVEPAFTLALRASETLYQEAYEQGVILVSPTTLLATLSMVENLWENERRIQNVEAIAERGGHVLDKIRLVMEAFSEVGKRLNQAQESYTKARGRLVDGRGNLRWQAETLRELGAKSDKTLPEVEQMVRPAQ